MLIKSDYLPEYFINNFIKPGVKIKVTRLIGSTKLSHFFLDKKCDTAYIRFFNHPFFETLMADIFLFKKGKILRKENGFIMDNTNLHVSFHLIKDLRNIESKIEILKNEDAKER